MLADGSRIGASIAFNHDGLIRFGAGTAKRVRGQRYGANGAQADRPYTVLL